MCQIKFAYEEQIFSSRHSFIRFRVIFLSISYAIMQRTKHADLQFPLRICLHAKSVSRIKGRKNSECFRQFVVKEDSCATRGRSKRCGAVHNEKTHILCCPPNITVSMIESRRTRWLAHVICMEEKVNEEMFCGTT